MSSKTSTYSQEEMQHLVKGFSQDDIKSINPLLLRGHLSKEELACLSDTDKSLRKKFQARRSGYRYRLKNPEKAQEALKKLGEMGKAKREERKLKLHVEKSRDLAKKVPSKIVKRVVNLVNMPKKVRIAKGAIKQDEVTYFEDEKEDYGDSNEE